MDKGKKHKIAKSVAISILVDLARRYTVQSDKITQAHVCHFMGGRKDDSEELVIKAEGYPGALRIRIDVVDESYWESVKTESNEAVKEEEGV